MVGLVSLILDGADIWIEDDPMIYGYEYSKWSGDCEGSESGYISKTGDGFGDGSSSGYGINGRGHGAGKSYGKGPGNGYGYGYKSRELLKILSKESVSMVGLVSLILSGYDIQIDPDKNVMGRGSGHGNGNGYGFGSHHLLKSSGCGSLANKGNGEGRGHCFGMGELDALRKHELFLRSSVEANSTESGSDDIIYRTKEKIRIISGFK